jgi:acetylornithine deacetylase
MRTEIKGQAVHSSDPSKGVNAINAAMRLISKIEELEGMRAANPIPNSSFTPPFATFNIGTIEGGAARNATAGWCNFNWEYRPMPGEDGQKTIEEVDVFAQQEILPSMQAIYAGAEIKLITEVAVPALDDRNAAAAVSFVTSITGANSQEVVSFGTDAGYISDASYSTVVIGPGDIKRAHRENEYITTGELSQGIDFISKIVRQLPS